MKHLGIYIGTLGLAFAALLLVLSTQAGSLQAPAPIPTQIQECVGVTVHAPDAAENRKAYLSSFKKRGEQFCKLHKKDCVRCIPVVIVKDGVK